MCKRDSVADKKLSIFIADSAITTVPPGLLNQIWNEAEIILSHHSVIDCNAGVYCITEHGGSTNVSISRGKIYCKCRKFTSTAGLCPHALAVAETNGNLAEYLTKFNSSEDKLKKIAFANIPQRAGEKPKEKKKRKGKNNISQKPINEEAFPTDEDIDFQKPLAFTEIWHNKNDFVVVFTKDYIKATRCESCKVEFARGGVVCIPHDIAVLHMERFLYPKKDANGNLLRMEPTWSKETARFYCANKRCIVQRHPYFWKGMLKIGSDTTTKFKEGHVKHLKEMFHFDV